MVEFATTVAPGVRDVLLTGKAFEATRRREGQQYAYDAVVVDAPPTGRIGRFLNVNAEVAGLAKVGPIRRQADAIMGLLRSPRTAVHLVTLLEEMPVQETQDAVGRAARARPPGRRRHRQPDPTPGAARCPAPGRARRRALDAYRDRRRAGGRRTRRPRRAAGRAVAGRPRSHAERVQLERSQRRQARRPRTNRWSSLPWLADGVDLAGLYQLERPAGPARRVRCLGDDPLPSTWTRCSHDPATTIIVCCGSGGVGKTTTAASLGVRAAQRGRRVCVLTIDPARRLAQSLGLEELDNTPARSRCRQGRRRALRDDARHEAHLRRDRAAARRPGTRRADPREPLLPVALQLVRRHAGVHGDGEARPAAPGGRRDRRVGPRHRRHPAEPLRARLPRRAGAARVLPRRSVHPHPAGPGPRRRQGLHEGLRRGLHARDQRH